MHLSEASARFIASISHPLTAASYRGDLRLFQAWLVTKYGGGADSVLKFTRENLVDYLATLAGSRTASTRHRKLAVFRKFAKWGRLNDCWKDTPTDGVESIAKARRLPRPFTDDEEKSLKALTLSPRENALRALLFYSGLRATPAARLRVQDVSVSPPRITYLAKGGKERAVPMHPKLKDILWDYIANHTDLQGPTYVFRNAWGRPLDRKALEKLTASWGRQARVAHCVPHRFRHTLATRLLRATGNLRHVQDALGHADIGSSVLYTHVAPTELEEAINRLE